MIIYKATNLVNGKVYIGQTIRELEKRKKEHFYHASCKNKNLVFHKALLKYGIDSFSWEVIDTVETQEELNDKERHWIKYYSSFGKNGYNMNDGGSIGGNSILSENDVLRIKEMIKNIIPIKDIAREYNVDRDVITRLKCGRNWSHVGEDVSYIEYPRLGDAKLTEDDVMEIKILLKENDLTQLEIAKMFEVSKGTIVNIKRGKSWRHIGEDLSHINYKEKLNEDVVREIKLLLKEGNLTQTTIAKIYSISTSVITSIKQGKTWGHVA